MDSSTAPCLPAPIPTVDLRNASLDALMIQAARRSAEILELLRPHVTLVDAGQNRGLQMRLEPLGGAALQALSEAEVAFVRARMRRVNTAIRNGDIELTPGLSSARLVNRRAAFDALAPGFFGGDAVQEVPLGRVPSFLAVVSGQWFPPGITIELTPQETDQLIDALLLGSFGAVLATLESFGLAAELCVPLALALLAAAAIVKICKELSATGAVGFKIYTLVPPFVSVTPYPA